jgi:hypothetical protein
MIEIEQAISKCLSEHLLVKAVNGASIYRMTDGVTSQYRVMDRDMREHMINDECEAVDEFLVASDAKD